MRLKSIISIILRKAENYLSNDRQHPMRKENLLYHTDDFIRNVGDVA